MQCLVVREAQVDLAVRAVVPVVDLAAAAVDLAPVDSVAAVDRLDSDQASTRRYSLNFTAMARNVLNNVNLAQPVGVLESPLFGKSNALSPGDFLFRRVQSQYRPSGLIQFLTIEGQRGIGANK